MSLDFVAIDFETANPKRASVIQIGVARVLNGVITGRSTRMIMPPAEHREFAYFNSRVHGLTAKDIDGAQEWPEILEILVRYAGDLPLVGHNVSVERSCIVQATEACGLEVPTFEYLCTQQLAKRRMPGELTYKLDAVTGRLGLPAFAHHDAGEDAVACVNIVMALAEAHGATDVHDLWAMPALKP
jgi:DNA polymerase-3 subunit epsilon